MIKTVLFDLDGTITDPGLGITNSIMYSLSKFGITVSDRKELYPFIGPPLWESFERFFGFSKEQAQKAVDEYRVYYKDKGIFECELYEGMNELFKKLKEKGLKVVMATSKPEVFAKRLAEHFEFSQYFDLICGSMLDGTRKEKDEVIEHAIKTLDIDPSTAVMVGDRMYDILGGKKFSMKTVGVSYGYGEVAELKEHNADFIANSVLELEEILLSDRI